MRNLVQGLALLLTASLLTGCINAKVKDTPSLQGHYALEPCWLSTPYGENAQGVFAITSEFGSSDTLVLSRRQAVTSLAEALNLPTNNLDQLDFSQSRVTLGGRNLGLAPTWTHQGRHYSYAYLANPQADRWVKSGCSPASCEPQNCSPAWLCEDNQGEYLAAVTVSQLAANASEQYRYLFENALKQLKTTHGVRLASERTQLTTRSGSATNLQVYLRERQNTQIEFAETNDQQALVLTNACRLEDTLYGRVELLGVTNPDLGLEPVNSRWHENLASPGEKLAIGHFSGILSHNLISLRIEYALRNALLQLARSQAVAIRSDQVQLDQLDGGHYSMQLVTEEMTLTRQVRVRGVRFMGRAADPEVFVLVEALD
ncbi:hypothetical protein [Marinospirillum perlucidum]|uniref:hypothetical protein n=1 Tax=Marinospirillum perlucidum TaxID=1982602 RepID=UPI000DF18DE0|nr:hypothetical protein [Marinospirillum perlucidum]